MSLRTSRQREAKQRAFPQTSILVLSNCVFMVLYSTTYIANDSPTNGMLFGINSTRDTDQAYHNQTSDILNSINNTKKTLDYNSIRYISGKYGYNTKFDALVEQRCLKHMGYYINDLNSSGEIDDPTCTGPIPHILSCCYCYKNVYPSFVHEEANALDHIEFLQLNNKIHKTSILGQNTYKNENHPDSYYFCMEQRKYSLSKEWNKADVIGKSRIIVLTGKWGYQSQFRDDVKRICNKLQRNRWVDYVHCYYDETDFTINDKRFERHMRYRYNSSDSSSRGGGYWFHKAVVMRHHMDSYNDNDFLLWVDIDTMHIFEPIRFYKLIQTMQQRNADVAFEIMRYTEQGWTKEDILAAFNATDTMRDSRQVFASFQLVRNSQKMKRYYDAIIECNSDYHMISDEPSIIPNRQKFKENRHDQSIYSLFYKKFLSNQTIIGPPIQTAMSFSNFYTFNLNESIHVECPFADFYKNPTVIELRKKDKKDNQQKIIMNMIQKKRDGYG